MELTDRKDKNAFSKKVGEKEKRKLRAQKERKPNVWMGLKMFGIVGWSVTVPTLLGAILGNWLDKAYPETFSWTLSLLVLGLFIGCMLAGHWITQEHKEMNQEDEKEE